jgi:HAE1 family hydrophobic/amphiphilic exporter-1
LIDDAIVVIENIVRHRTELKEGAREAAQKATAEIGLAVLATTMSIVAVFVPVAFMEGMVGQFFSEFGLTVAFAVRGAALAVRVVHAHADALGAHAGRAPRR